MKKLLLVAVLFASIGLSAQRVDLNYSVNKQYGLNAYHVFPSGFILGAGGSYMFDTYFGETGGKHQELLNTYLGNDGDLWSPWFRANYNVTSFTENRGTVKALVGLEVKSVSLYSSVGLAFRSKYWKGTGYDGMPYFTSPQRNFFVYKNISPTFLYGLHAAKLITEHVGVNAGWDNISGASIGLSFKF